MNTSLPVQVALTAAEIRNAEAAVREAQWIDPGSDLTLAASQWSQATTLGLDTEFVRERTFYPRPGLVQISNGQDVWLLDPVDRSEFSGLTQVLGQASITKILHSTGEDLEIFQLLTGTLPRPLFDTQIAAAMLGMPLQCRYEHLVAQCFGVELPGGQARSDWCRRPLSHGLLSYAAQDVIWLSRLQAELGAALDRAGRLVWLHEDCARLIRRAETTDKASPLVRVKGAGRLDDPSLARLEVLARWREETARARDLPRSFVVRDEALIGLAASAGTDALARAMSELPHPVRRRYGEVLTALLADPPNDGFTRPVELVAPDPEQRQALKQAQATVRKIAEELQIDPALIASKRELTRLVRGEKPDWLDGWRGELIGHLPDHLPG